MPPGGHLLRKGDLAGNLSAHLRLVDQAAAAGCQLAVFPEMSLTGSADPRPTRSG